MSIVPEINLDSPDDLLKYVKTLPEVDSMLDWMSGKKKPPRCKYPDCGKPATTHWALVDLCDEHREVIRKETYVYYRNRITYWNREEYHKISQLIPWSQAMTRERGEEDEEVTTCGM